MRRSMATIQVLSRFQGCLVGAVLGDCIGSVFEGMWATAVSVEKVVTEVKKIEAEAQKGDKSKKVWEFTDDTAMARSVARSLIEHKGFNDKDMAKKFSEEYYKEPDRGYGMGVLTVFLKLKECNYMDPYRAAREQFDGSGSYGNGGAMRICPAPLFAQKYKSPEKLAEMVEKITSITHSHRQAIDGAIMESFAVDLALQCNGAVDVNAFIDQLKSRMEKVDKRSMELTRKNSTKKPEKNQKGDEESKEEDNSYPYCKILEKVRSFATQEEKPAIKDIREILGTDIAAFRSVPAAVYSFLRASKYTDDFEDRNPYERTIMLAISLGGDTDTIATMAGAIAGACYGIGSVPEAWQKCCEGVDDAKQFAEELYKLQEEDQS